jgi:hypothetical protein
MKMSVIISLFWVLSLLLGLCIPLQAQNIELTVIGNPGSVPEQLDIAQLRSVLKGEKLRWDDGVSVKIALMKTNTSVGSTTSERIYNMSANELNKYFLALVFQGKAKAPIFFTSESELESYVARTPGAIGVSSRSTDGTVRVIVIDGRSVL